MRVSLHDYTAGGGKFENVDVVENKFKYEPDEGARKISKILTIKRCDKTKDLYEITVENERFEFLSTGYWIYLSVELPEKYKK